MSLIVISNPRRNGKTRMRRLAQLLDAYHGWTGPRQ